MDNLIQYWFRLQNRSNIQMRLEERLSKRLTLIYTIALFCGLFLVSMLIILMNYRVNQYNLQRSQVLLENTLRTQLSYFEFAGTQENLDQFSQILKEERMVLRDRYGKIRAQTGTQIDAASPDEKIGIQDQSGEIIGTLEIWYRPFWIFRDFNFLWVLVTTLLLLVSLSLLRRAFSRVLEEDVISPLRNVISLIQDTPRREGSRQNLMKSADKRNEFDAIVQTYLSVYDSLAQESQKRESQYRLVDEALVEAGISLTYHDKSGEQTSTTIGAKPPSEVLKTMQEANVTSPTLAQSVKKHCAKYEEITRLHPHKANEMQTSFQVQIEEPRLEYWLLIDIPFPNGTAILGKNITASHIAELELRHVQKMDALGALASGVAHDFNNLLSIVVASLDIIQMSDKVDNELQALLDQSQSALDRASSIARNMLAYGRKSQIRLTSVSPDALFASLQKMIKTGERSAVTYEFLKHSDVHINLDRELLEAALLNLLINSGHAMQQRGHISVTYRNASPKERALMAPTLRENVVTIEVRDDGPGIPEAIIGKVCDPFFTTKPSNQGSGLGLSMVAGFAKQSDGAFVLQNEKKGVSAKIILPAKSGRQAETIQPTNTLEPCAQSGVVLAVDDNIHLLSLIEKSIKLRGHQCLTATCYQDAKACIQSHPEPINALVTDFNLTDGDGVDIVREYRKINKHGRAILISGNAELGDPDELFDKALQKPFSLRQLIEAIEGTPAELPSRLSEPTHLAH